MTNGLSTEEAEEVAISILPTVNRWISVSMFEKAHLRVSDIANIVQLC